MSDERRCPAPHPYVRDTVCGQAVVGRSDKKYCSNPCKRRAWEAKPEVQHRKRLQQVRAALEEAIRMRDHQIGLVAYLSQELARLEGRDVEAERTYAEVRGKLAPVFSGTAPDDPAYRNVHLHPRTCVCPECQVDAPVSTP